MFSKQIEGFDIFNSMGISETFREAMSNSEPAFDSVLRGDLHGHDIRCGFASIADISLACINSNECITRKF